jgi:hypothetical protein
MPLSSTIMENDLHVFCIVEIRGCWLERRKGTLGVNGGLISLSVVASVAHPNFVDMFRGWLSRLHKNEFEPGTNRGHGIASI